MPPAWRAEARSTRPGGGGREVVVQPTPAPEVNVRVVNTVDVQREVFAALQTQQGERLVVNAVSKNRRASQRALA